MRFMLNAYQRFRYWSQVRISNKILCNNQMKSFSHFALFFVAKIPHFFFYVDEIFLLLRSPTIWCSRWEKKTFEFDVSQ